MVAADLLGRGDAGRERKILPRQVRTRDLARTRGGNAHDEAAPLQRRRNLRILEERILLRADEAVKRNRRGSQRVARGAQDSIPDAEDEQDGQPDGGDPAGRLGHRRALSAAGTVITSSCGPGARTFGSGVRPCRSCVRLAPHETTSCHGRQSRAVISLLRARQRVVSAFVRSDGDTSGLDSNDERAK